MSPTLPEIIGAVLFTCALIHTFTASFFEQLARRQPRHAGIYHLLGEIEVVFGFWAGILFLFLLATVGKTAATSYLNSRNYTEPLFVFVIMVMAGSRPILQWVNRHTLGLAKKLPLPGVVSIYVLSLSVLPLLGSAITEPAAMTIAALILGREIFARNFSLRFKYLSLGVLLVNVSIGGTLTSFAAPPVLMVAARWGWDTPHMYLHFGDKAVLAVLINTVIATLVGWRELKGQVFSAADSNDPPIPWAVTAVHLFLLAGTVIFAHDAPVFIGIFLLFMGVATAYPKHQNRLMLREGLLVAFFLGGLVVLGGLQAWWLQPMLSSLGAGAVFIGAIGLTAVVDNAALTYLGSLVPNLSDSFKYLLVAGAVTGGGLTVIANAPNPAGIAILRRYFPDHAVSALGLLVGAAVPTLVSALVFYFWLD